MNAKVYFSRTCYETTQIRRSWMERLFTLPWHPFQVFRTVTIPGMYREGDRVLVHTSRVDDIYKIMHRDEDAPTLKIKAVR